MAPLAIKLYKMFTEPSKLLYLCSDNQNDANNSEKQCIRAYKKPICLFCMSIVKLQHNFMVEREAEVRQSSTTETNMAENVAENMENMKIDNDKKA